MGLIYCATFKNGKKYIGQTMQTLQERISQHKYNSITKKDNYIFHKAIRKYGFESIEWSILENNIFSKEELNEKEIFWIKKENTYYKNKNSNGYNMTKGGNNYDHACLFDETSKIAQEIYEKYKECGSTLKVAKEYNCGVNTINSLLEKIDKNWKRFTTVGKASPKIFSEEECITIYEEYKEIGRINILAEKYNVSRCTISSLLKELDSDYEKFYKRGKFTKEEEKEIYEFYKINRNIKQTAKKFNSSWETISSLLKRMDSNF